MPRAVLLASDNGDRRDRLEGAMRSLGLCVHRAGTGAEVLRALECEALGLVLIATDLPDVHALDLCRRIRRESDLPLIVLTEGSDELARVLVLELGADDVVAEGCGDEELQERVKAALRRGTGITLESEDDEVLDFGHIVIDRSARSLTIADGTHELTPIEAELLWMLARHAGEVVTSEELLESVWGYPRGIKTRTLDVHVGRIRRRLGEDGRNPRHIITVRSVGYCFEPNPDADAQRLPDAA